jgi:hypothetical protein
VVQGYVGLSFSQKIGVSGHEHKVAKLLSLPDIPANADGKNILKARATQCNWML